MTVGRSRGCGTYMHLTGGGVSVQWAMLGSNQ
jgi:hypothetical protein